MSDLILLFSEKTTLFILDVAHSLQFITYLDWLKDVASAHNIEYATMLQYTLILAALAWIIMIATLLNLFRSSLFAPKKLSKSGGPKCVSVPGWPIIGNFGYFLDLKQFHVTVLKLCQKYGPVIELRMFSKRIIVISDPALARECMTKRPKTFRRASSMTDSLTAFESSLQSLFFAEGDNWARMRRLTSPSFNHKNVSHMRYAIGNQIDQFIARLRPSADANKTVQMDVEFFCFTIRVMSAAAFGGLANTEFRDYFYEQLMADVNVIFETVLERVLIPLPLVCWNLLSYLPGRNEAVYADRRFTDNCKLVIAEKKAELAHALTPAPVAATEGASADVDPTSTTNIAPSAARTLIESLMRATSAGDKALSDEEILANVKVFFLAGSDTTSVVLTWSAYQLATHPALRAEVQAEVEAAVGTDEVTGEDFVAAANRGALPLCGACFQETLRVNGPASFLILSTIGNQSATLSNGLVIRPGDDVNLCLDGCTLDPVVYPNPTQYDPHRWILPPSPSDHDLARLHAMEKDFLAFGYGPRVCPGMALAHSEGVACLASLVYYFDLELACAAAEVKRELNFVTKASHMPVNLKARR